MVEPTGPGSAERAELAAPSSRDAIIDITRAGIVNSWNPPAVLLYGYLAEDMVGRAADVLCPLEERDHEADILRRILAGGGTERFEADRVGKDGSVVRVSLTVAPIVGQAGAITGVTTASWKVGGRQGVHDQVEAGIESERRNSREAQQRFDIKVDSVRRESRDAQERFDARVDTERRESRDAQERFDIRVEAQRRGSRKAQDQVEAEIESVRRDAWEIQDRFDERRDGERREAVELNEHLVNLAVNARDAMPGGGSLSIDTGNITVDDDSIAGGSPARPGRHVRLRVSDSGTGMPADVAAHAFEPFFTTKVEGAGTGLGLATVYGIVSQAGGDIQIYSEPGAGTTFSIVLPVTAEAAVMARTMCPISAPPRERPSWSSRTRKRCVRWPGGSSPATAIT